MPTTDRSSMARGKQLAVLATIAHEKATAPEIGELIEKAVQDMNELCASCGEGVNQNDDLTTARRILELEKEAYQKQICIPSELAARKAELEASANHAWFKVRLQCLPKGVGLVFMFFTESGFLGPSSHLNRELTIHYYIIRSIQARENNDFESFTPALKDCFDTAAEIANLQRGIDKKEDISLYSQMLDEFEMGMPSERIDKLFNEVQFALVPFIAKIRASTHKPSVAPLSGHFPVEAQKKASRIIVNDIGFDESHGRIDVSVHPFTTALSSADVRITVRFTEQEWLQGLMGTIHEGE